MVSLYYFPQKLVTFFLVVGYRHRHHSALPSSTFLKIQPQNFLTFTRVSPPCMVSVTRGGPSHPLVTPLAMAGKTVSLRCVGDRFCHGATGYHTSRRQGRV